VIDVKQSQNFVRYYSCEDGRSAKRRSLLYKE